MSFNYTCAGVYPSSAVEKYFIFNFVSLIKVANSKFTSSWLFTTHRIPRVSNYYHELFQEQQYSSGYRRVGLGMNSCMSMGSCCLMMKSSNGNFFRVTCPLCGEFTGPGELPAQRPVTRSFDVFFDLRLNKRLSKQPWCWWFETPSWSLWRQCNVAPISRLTQWVLVMHTCVSEHLHRLFRNGMSPIWQQAITSTNDGLPSMANSIFEEISDHTITFYICQS